MLFQNQGKNRLLLEIIVRQSSKAKRDSKPAVDLKVKISVALLDAWKEKHLKTTISQQNKMKPTSFANWNGYSP